MPKIWESTSVIIEAGTAPNVGWGPDFGDASDDTSFIAIVGAPTISAIALDSTITVIGQLILSAAISADFTIIAECTARIENLGVTYTGPWTALGTISGELGPDYNLLIAAGLVQYDLSTIYDVLIAQGAVVLNAIDTSYTGPWTALGTIAGDLGAVYTGPWTLIGTVAGDLAVTYTLLTCQGTVVADTLALDNTITCTCAPLIITEAIVFTGPHTCQGAVGTLDYVLDFTAAATTVDIDVTAPPGTTSLFSETWAGGGGGATTATVNGGGGGGGGGFASDTQATAANDIITVRIGAGGATGAAGGESYVKRAGTTICRSTGGGAGVNGAIGGQGAGGAAGAGATGDTLRNGGAGGGNGGVQTNGGGGGGGAGTANAGNAGAANRTAGTGGALLGGDGGTGAQAVPANAATVGNVRGGGGGGVSTTAAAAAGAKGGVRITFSVTP